MELLSIFFTLFFTPLMGCTLYIKLNSSIYMYVTNWMQIVYTSSVLKLSVNDLMIAQNQTKCKLKKMILILKSLENFILSEKKSTKAIEYSKHSYLLYSKLMQKKYLKMSLKMKHRHQTFVLVFNYNNKKCHLFFIQMDFLSWNSVRIISTCHLRDITLC